MNVIVIGLGSMGKRRIRILKEYDDISIFGVDNNQDRCDEVRKLFSIECFNSIQKAKNAVDFKCAFVCTSPLSHSAIIHECLELDAHVFTEINLVKDGYEENIKLASKKGLVLFLSSTPLYQSEMKAVIERTKENNSKLDYIFHVGQYLPDWHPWESFNNYFIGNPRTNGCREILAIELPWMVTAFGEIESVYSLHSKNTDIGIDYDDNYLISIKHKTGAKGVFAVDVVARKPIRHLEIYGESMQISWEGTIDTLTEYDIDSKTDRKIELSDIPEHVDGYVSFITENPYKEEVRVFFQQIKDNDYKPVWNFESDLRILNIIDEIENT